MLATVDHARLLPFRKRSADGRWAVKCADTGAGRAHAFGEVRPAGRAELDPPGAVELVEDVRVGLPGETSR